MGRRSLLFLSSYAPLAAMFIATQWPSGWSATKLALLALFLGAAVSTVLVGGAALLFTPGRRKNVLLTVSVVAIVVAVVGIVERWYGPLAWRPPQHHGRATVAGAALVLAVAGFEVAAIIFYSARQTSNMQLQVVDARDQGGAVAGYLATYLLPLLSVSVSTWNVAAAYGIYLLALYVIFVRSSGLVLVNPSLYLFGYRIFDVRLDPPDGENLPDSYRRRVLLFVRGGLDERTPLTVVDLGEDCYVSVR